MDVLSEIRARDSELLAALYREQYEMTRAKAARLTSRVAPAHRVVPVSLAPGEERNGAKGWRCANCGRRFRFPDEAEDSICNAEPLPW